MPGGTLLDAVDGAGRVGLVRALERAAAAGLTSSTETLLGALAARYPDSLQHESERALNRAVAAHQWATASYLADTLAGKGGGTALGGDEPRLGRTDAAREIAQCLATSAPPPFRLTDAVEDVSGGTAAGPSPFRLTDAIVTTRRGGGAGSAADGEATDDKPSGDGAPVRFIHVDTRLPPEAYGSAARPCPFFSLSEPDRSAAVLQGGGDAVVPAGPIRLRLAAPPEAAGVFDAETDGTRAGLARAVAAVYRRALRAGASRDLAEVDLESVAPDGDAFAVGVAT